MILPAAGPAGPVAAGLLDDCKDCQDCYYNPISGCPRKNSPTKKLRPNNLKFHIFSNSENYKRKIHYTKIIKTCIKIHVFIQDKI